VRKKVRRGSSFDPSPALAMKTEIESARRDSFVLLKEGGQLDVSREKRTRLTRDGS
jgi:hypothetical protein